MVEQRFFVWSYLSEIMVPRSALATKSRNIFWNIYLKKRKNLLIKETNAVFGRYVNQSVVQRHRYMEERDSDEEGFVFQLTSLELSMDLFSL